MSLDPPYAPARRLFNSVCRVHDEIEGSGCLSAECFQVTVAVNEGGRTPQKQTLQRMAWFKACGTEANLLGNQQWCLHRLLKWCMSVM